MHAMPVALFSDRAKAEPVLQQLKKSGFDVRLKEGEGLGKLWFVARKTADVRLEVPADQFNRAEQFLLDWDQREGALRQAIRCPECGALRVNYPQYARHSLLTNLAMGLLAQLGVIEKEYYCEDCHFSWPREGTRASQRPHLAPFYFIDGVEQTGLKGAPEPQSSPVEEHREAA